MSEALVQSAIDFLNFVLGVAATAALGLLLKVTAVLVVAWGIVRAFPRASAAHRHLVWTASLGLILVLPFAIPVVPHWEAPFLSRVISRWSNSEGVLVALSTLDTLDRPLPPLAWSASNSTGDGQAFASGVNFAQSGGGSSSAERVFAALPKWNENPWGAATLLAFAVWVAGTFVTLARAVHGHLALRRVAANLTPLEDPALLAFVRESSRRVGIRRPVLVGTSALTPGPITWGTRRAHIALPTEARSWSFELQRVALQHELAHISRHDVLTQWGGTMARALYWFHPLVIATSSRQRAEAERACDDHVLSTGLSPADYASHLLAVAKQALAGRGTSLAGVSMARETQLEGRVLALFDEQLPRQRTSLAARLAVAGFGAALLVPIAGLQSTSALAAPSAKHTQSVSKSDSTVRHSFNPVEAGGTLKIRLASGGDVVIEGSNDKAVTVKSMLGGRDAENTELQVEHTDYGILVAAMQENDSSTFSTSHEFHITVPRKYNVDIRSAGGDVTLRRLEGTFEGQTGGGDVTIHDSKGTAQISTGGGDINLENVRLEGKISTGGGDVRKKNVSGGIQTHTGSGDSSEKYNGDSDGDEGHGDGHGDGHGEGHFAASAGGKGTSGTSSTGGATGPIVMSTGGGDIDLPKVTDGSSLTTGGGDVTVGSSSGSVNVSTGGGDVSLGEVSGDLEISTGAGDIQVGPLQGSLRATTGAGDAHIVLAETKDGATDVALSSGSGDITLVIPENCNARIELETAYTKNREAHIRFEGGVTLETWTSEKWDSSQGTPRKYVRSKGTLGAGKGLIKIKTVNGDIVIKKAKS